MGLVRQNPYLLLLGALDFSAADLAANRQGKLIGSNRIQWPSGNLACAADHRIARVGEHEVRVIGNFEFGTVDLGEPGICVTRADGRAVVDDHVADIVIEAGCLEAECISSGRKVVGRNRKAEFVVVGLFLVQARGKRSAVEHLVDRRGTLCMRVGTEHREVVVELVVRRQFRRKRRIVLFALRYQPNRCEPLPVDARSSDERQPVIPDELVLCKQTGLEVAASRVCSRKSSFGLTGLIGGGYGVNETDWAPRFSASGPEQSIPEPATLALVGAALFGLAATRRRQPASPTA